jgi:hypothetical protein
VEGTLEQVRTSLRIARRITVFREAYRSRGQRDLAYSEDTSSPLSSMIAGLERLRFDRAPVALGLHSNFLTLGTGAFEMTGALEDDVYTYRFTSFCKFLRKFL